MTKREVEDLIMFNSEVYVGPGLFSMVFAGINQKDPECIDLLVPHFIIDKMKEMGQEMAPIWTVKISKVRSAK